MEEKTADEMFEELGYVKVIDENNIYYNRQLSNYNTKVMQFKTFINTVVVYLKDAEGEMLGTDSITMPELQAINKKCKELGWL